MPGQIRSDNGPEFIARLGQRLAGLGTQGECAIANRSTASCNGALVTGLPPTGTARGGKSSAQFIGKCDDLD